MTRSLAAAIAGLALAVAPLAAQGKGKGHGPKHYAASTDQAFSVTKDVLAKHGYAVVRTEVRGDDEVVYYYRGNMGKGKGHGPMQTMIIRRIPAENRIVFVNTPGEFLVDINIRLGGS